MTEFRNLGSKSLVIRTLLVTCLIAFTVFIYAGYPGRFDGDSASQYFQAKVNSFHNFHPLTTTVLLKVLHHFGPGPGPMFILQFSLYMLGCFLICRYFFVIGRPYLAYAMLITLLSPPILFSFLDIQKDALLTASTLLLLGIGLSAERAAGRRRTLLTIIFWFFAVFAADARTNGIILILPAVIASTWFLVPGTNSRRAVACCVAFCVVLGGLVGWNYVLASSLKVHRVHPLKVLVLFDLAGITARTRQDVSGGYAGEAFMATVDRCYSASGWDTFLDGPCAAQGELFSRNFLKDSDRTKILKLWLQNIKMHPRAYLAHRTEHMAFLLRLKCGRCSEPMVTELNYLRPYSTWIPNLDFDGTPRSTAFARGLEYLAFAYYQSIFARGYLLITTLLICFLCLLPFALKCKCGHGILIFLAFSLSALLYVAGFWVIGVSEGWRYFHIALTMAAACFVLLFSSVINVLRANFRRLDPSSTVRFAK